MSEATPAIALDAVCCCGCGLSGGEFAVPPPVGSWATSTVLNARKAKNARNRFRRALRATVAVPLLPRGLITAVDKVGPFYRHTTALKRSDPPLKRCFRT